MKVLVVYPFFVDTQSAGHSLMFEALHALAQRGHDVTVVSGEGGYMQGNAPQRPWWRRLVSSERVGDVRVLRTLSWRGHQNGLLGRLASYALLSSLNPVGVLMAGRADVALLSPPPLYPIFTSLLACRLRRIPVVTEVRDLWPGSLEQMGLLKNRWLLALSSWMERMVYDHSRLLLTLTDGIRTDIVQRGWRGDRVVTLPCAVDMQELAPDPAARRFLRESHGWGERFVLLYFGALGEANNLPVLLRAALRLLDDPHFLVVTVGDGFRRAWFEEQVHSMGLTNLQVLPASPKSQARAYLNAADACLVTLQDLPVFAGAIPTKLIEAMACARPVLCGVRGEARHIVIASGGGYCFEPDDESELIRRARQLRADPAHGRALGEAGRRHVEAHYDGARRHAKLAGLLDDVCRAAWENPGRL